jgi:hypothetical protein
MPTLIAVKPETVSPGPAGGPAGFPIDAALRKLAPNLARAASETAGAFFNVPASLASSWEAPRIPELGRIHCSQKNVGEKYEMICNLTADKFEWEKLFPAGVDERLKMDAYCELANCMCGALLADPGFSDWFGYLIPCVPCSGSGRAGEGSHAIKGALRLNGAWILFSFAVRECEAAASSAGHLTAAA